MLQESKITSKYIKNNRVNKIFDFMALLYMISLYILPQYFGLSTPVFDFTALRAMLIIMLLIIISVDARKKKFFAFFYSTNFFIWLPYGIVTIYTMIMRVDISSFLNTFLEILEFFLIVYIIEECWGLKKTIKVLQVFIFILLSLGIIEYFLKQTPFIFLETIQGLKTASAVRSGQYRVMSSCIHSIGYGLLLITAMPIICIDIENNNVDIFKHPFGITLLLINVVLTGSRAPLAISIAEFMLIFLLSDKKKKRRNIFALFFAFLFLCIILIVFQNTNLGQYCMLQITSVLDEILGTELAVKFGADTKLLGGSSSYRGQLIYIFTLSWLNPIIGQGRKFTFRAVVNGITVQSIDNYYVAEFIRYAYPGLIAFVMFVSYYVIKFIKAFWQNKSLICGVIVIGCLAYLGALCTVDSLGTLKYLYTLFAIGIYVCENMQEIHKDNCSNSKYINRNKWRRK